MGFASQELSYHEVCQNAIWNLELGTDISEEDWWELFPNFIRNIFPTKLRFLQYCLLSKAITTNVLRNKWDIEISPNCEFCQDAQETILHVFCECELVENLWKKAEQWIQSLFGIQISFSKELIIFNNYKGVASKLMNTFIIILKQLIYSCKCQKIVPTFELYTDKSNYWYQLERLTAIDAQQFDKFNKISRSERIPHAGSYWLLL